MNRNKRIVTLAMAAALTGTAVTAIPAVSTGITVNAQTLAASSEVEQSTQIKTKDVSYGKLLKSDREMLKEMFDAEYYAKQNPDVVAEFGNSEEALFQHFCQFGIFEQRMANADFNVAAYASAYGDLQKAFGNDVMSYYKHYSNYGKNETRSLTTVAKCAKAGIAVYSVGSFQKGTAGPVAAANGQVASPVVTPAQYTQMTGEATPGNAGSAAASATNIAANAWNAIAAVIGGGSVPSTPSTPSTPSAPVVNYTKTEVVGAEEATTQQLKEGVVKEGTEEMPVYVQYSEVDASEAVGLVPKEGYQVVLADPMDENSAKTYYELGAETTEGEATQVKADFVQVDDKYYSKVPSVTASMYTMTAESYGATDVDGSVVFYNVTDTQPGETEGYVNVSDTWYKVVDKADTDAELVTGYAETAEGVVYSTAFEVPSAAALEAKEGYISIKEYNAETETIDTKYYAATEVEESVATEEGVKSGYVLDGDTYKKVEFLTQEQAFETVVKDGYTYNEETGQYTHEVPATEAEATTRVIKAGYTSSTDGETTTYYRLEEATAEEALSFVQKDNVYYDEANNRFVQVTADTDDSHIVEVDGLHIIAEKYGQYLTADEDTPGYVYNEETGKWFKWQLCSKAEATEEDGETLKDGYGIAEEKSWWIVGNTVADEDAYEDKLAAGVVADGNSSTGYRSETPDEGITEATDGYVEVDGSFYEEIAADAAVEEAHVLKEGLVELDGAIYDSATQTTEENAYTDDTEHFVQINGEWFEIGSEVTAENEIYDVTLNDGFETEDTNENGILDSEDTFKEKVETTESEATELQLNPGFSSDAE